MRELRQHVLGLRALGVKPRVHGNGFIQLNLTVDGLKRLHVWHDLLPRQKVGTPIHDHVFALRSTVLTGTLIHKELEADEEIDGSTHRVYRARQEPGSQNTVLVPDEIGVCLTVVQKLVLGEGSVYTFPAWTLHETEHRGLTATFMEKLNAPEDYGRPRVLCPHGFEPDNDFDREGHDPDTLWPFIDMALTA